MPSYAWLVGRFRMEGMKKHPEDADDWTSYANNPNEWQIPEAHPQPHDPQATDSTREVTGSGHPWSGQPTGPRPFDDRDPNPPRQSTPYNETNPWTNNQAWRYQQNPYEGDPAEHRSDFFKMIITGVALGLGVLALAFFLL